MKQIANDLFFQSVEAELAKGRNVRFRLKGTSMTPLLRNGKDEVLIAPCRSEELKKGDVVLFRHMGRHILHRIIDRKEHSFLLRGDGTWGKEEVCYAEDIVGVMIRIYRPSGREVSVDSQWWQTASRCWCALPLQVRRLLLRIYHCL